MTDTMTAPAPTKAQPSSFSFRQALKVLASLRLTVVLFALSMVLVFVGTLAQMDASIWTVVKQYFRSWFVWVPFQLFNRLGQVFVGLDATKQISYSWGFPFPGGWTIGSLLLVNLLSAHAIRFRMSWKRSGIMLLHLGVILLLVGEMITGLFQVEQKMTIAVGETVNFTDRSVPPEMELVLIVKEGDTQSEILIPQSKFKSNVPIKSDLLPCDLQILDYSPNSALVEAKQSHHESLQGSDGEYYRIVKKAEESGIDSIEDQPALWVKFLKKGTSEEIATGCFSMWHYRNLSRMVSVRGWPQFTPQQLTVDGKDFIVSLRPRREYKPHSIKLLEFRHDVYVGTDKPRNFSSLIQLQDPENNQDREVLIYMNSPMRYRGEAYFQSGVMPGDKGTVLHVVRNPGWLLPYIACAVVTLGMMVHFGIHLTGFLRKRALA